MANDLFTADDLLGRRDLSLGGSLSLETAASSWSSYVLQRYYNKDGLPRPTSSSLTTTRAISHANLEVEGLLILSFQLSLQPLHTIPLISWLSTPKTASLNSRQM